MEVEAISYTYTDDELRVLCSVLGMPGLPGRLMPAPDDALMRAAEDNGLISRVGDRVAADRLAAFLVAAMGQAESCVCVTDDERYLGLFRHYLACVVTRIDQGRWVLTPVQDPEEAFEIFADYASGASWAKSVIWGRDEYVTEEAGKTLVLQLKEILTALDSPFEGE